MNDIVLVPEHSLEGRTFAALRDAGADERSARAATRAMMHASRLGIDSHGVRLIPTRADHHALAQSRRPMDMMSQGWSMSLFHASQQ